MATEDLRSDSTQITPSVSKNAGFAASKIVHMSVEVDFVVLTAGGLTISAGTLIQLWDLPIGTIVLGLSENRVTAESGAATGKLSVGIVGDVAKYRAAALLDNTDDQDVSLHMLEDAAVTVSLTTSVAVTMTNYKGIYHLTALLPGA